MYSASLHSLHVIYMLLATLILFIFIVLLSSEGPLLPVCPLNLLTFRSLYLTGQSVKYLHEND